jgi:exonuclease-1
LKRFKEKEEYKEKAKKLMSEGKHEEAKKYFSRCIFIDEKIISKTINVMNTRNIEFMVAPYEADCQIAKLKNLNLIDAAISEDSDLIAYGVNTILKLNQNGECDYVDLKQWSPRDVDSEFLKEYLAMSFTYRVDVAILAGTDYNPSIHGIGIVKAVKHIYR